MIGGTGGVTMLLFGYRKVDNRFIGKNTLAFL